MTTPAPGVTSPAPNPAAARTLAAAAKVMQRARSYRFDVDERLVAASTLRTRLIGSLIRGQGLTYLFTVGRKRTEVVRLRHATYVRAVPRRWSRLRKPRRLANPTATLLAVLRGMSPMALRSDGRSRVVSGTLTGSAASKAGLPPTDRPVDVVVTLDRAGHVTALRLTAHTTASGHDVLIAVRGAYSGFGQVRRIRRPV